MTDEEKRQKINEQCLKTIIIKYCQNEELTEEEYALVLGYIFYSNPNILNSKEESLLLPSMIKIYGTGTFNKKELKVLRRINDEYKNYPKKS